MAAATDRMSFNPSWMGSTYSSSVVGSVSRSVSAEVPGEADGVPGKTYPMAPPKLAKNRYGREEMLALFQAGGDWAAPDAMPGTEFFVPPTQQPICETQYSEAEERVFAQGAGGINSSKAMSAVNHLEARQPPGFTTGFNPRWAPEAAQPAARPFGVPSHRGGFGGFGGRGGGRGGGVIGRGAPPIPGDENAGGPRAFGAPRGRGAVADRGGRGGIGRGGASATDISLNPRAQGLYDPKDPRDRPRARQTSVGESEAPSGRYVPPGVRNRWAAGGGGVPEWMDDDSDGEPEEGGVAPARGSFDENGKWVKQKKEEEEEAAEVAAVPPPQRERLKPKLMSAADGLSQAEIASAAVGPMGGSDRKRLAEILRKQQEEAEAKKQQTQLAEKAQQKQRNGNQSKPSQPASAKAPQPQIPPSQSVEKSRVGSGSEFEQHLQDAESLVNSFSEDDTAAALRQRNSEARKAAAAATAATAPVVPAQAPASGAQDWFYLDPRKQIQGPFKAKQMQSWFTAGYFQMDLFVKKGDGDFLALGELIKRFGRVPFSADTGTGGPPTPTAAPTVRTSMRASGEEVASVWGDPNPAPDATLTAKLAEVAEEKRRLGLEAARMAELEARVTREREEAARETRERDRRAAEEAKETARLRAEAEERKAAEDASKRAAWESAERARLAAEEQKRARAAAEDEERQRRLAERQKVEMAERQRLEKQESRLRLEQEERLRLQREAAKVKAEEEAAAESNFGTRISIQDLLRSGGTTGGISGTGWGAVAPPSRPKPEPPAASPWSAAAKSRAAVPRADGRSLREIQEEEERQLRSEQQQAASERREVQSAAVGTVWGSKGSGGLTWGDSNERSSPSSAAWGGAIAAPRSSEGFWDDEPSPAAAVAPQPQSKAAKKKAKAAAASRPKAAQQASQATRSEKVVKAIFAESGGGEDGGFTAWVVKEIYALDAAMDAQTFATFLVGVDSPNEVEEYVVSYFGEGRRSKDFMREFLQRRSEARSAARQRDNRDDLATPAAALNSYAADETPKKASPPATQGLAKGKKKKGKSKGVDISAHLGFSATSDPNRFNSGEIDTPQ